MPVMCCSPALRFSRTAVLTANGTQTLTPPRSLTTLTKEADPDEVVRTPDICSTVPGRRPADLEQRWICTALAGWPAGR
jgi:hypothetical protein